MATNGIGRRAGALALLIGWGGYVYVRQAIEQRAQQAELKRQEERQAERINSARSPELRKTGLQPGLGLFENG